MKDEKEKIQIIVVPDDSEKPHTTKSILYAVVSGMAYWMVRVLIPVLLYLVFRIPDEILSKWNYLPLDLITFIPCFLLLVRMTVLIRNHEPTRVLSNKILGAILFVTFGINILGLILSDHYNVGYMNLISCATGLFVFFKAILMFDRLIKALFAKFATCAGLIFRKYSVLRSRNSVRTILQNLFPVCFKDFVDLFSGFHQHCRSC